MIKSRLAQRSTGVGQKSLTLGTPGRLAIFAWSLVLVLFAPPDRFALAAMLALLLNATLYPGAIKRLFRPRWLLFACLLIAPSVLWAGGIGAADSAQNAHWLGFLHGLQMAARALVVIVAVDGLSSAVDIAEIAGILERAGMPGLGFSMGVAINLLPALRRSSLCTWRSLRMRGGFRRQWRRALQLLLVTIVTNALRRAEEIALAAEVRAFSPERTRRLPVKKGSLDWPVAVMLLASWLSIVRF